MNRHRVIRHRRVATPAVRAFRQGSTKMSAQHALRSGAGFILADYVSSVPCRQGRLVTKLPTGVLYEISSSGNLPMMLVGN